MPAMTQKSLAAAFSGAAADAEMQTIEKALRPLSASGFEFRGGDVFGQEIFSIYINDRTDEYAILRFNRPGNQPPLIVRGNLSELDQPMERMNTLPFVTVTEYLGNLPALAAQPMPAAAQPRKPGPGK